MRNSTPMEVTVMRKGLPVILAAVLILLLPWSAGGATVQKLTLTMRDFKYTPAKVNLQVGVPGGLTLINRGKVAHEFMIYDMPRQMSAMMMGHEWAEKTNYFRGHAVTVEGGKTNIRGRGGRLPHRPCRPDRPVGRFREPISGSDPALIPKDPGRGDGGGGRSAGRRRAGAPVPHPAGFPQPPGIRRQPGNARHGGAPLRPAQLRW